jgi:hypothetical protein
MLASEYARKLLEQVVIHGDYPVCVTQSGYYADGVFADWYEPSAPEEISEYSSKYEPKPYYVLGHSYQSY